MKSVSKKMLLIFIGLFFVFLMGIRCGKTEDRVEVFSLEPGKKTETEVRVIDSSRPGPTVVVIAGIHGNELSGVAALDSFHDIKLESGRLVVLPRANRLAVMEHKRTISSLGDLNRVFPGKSPGMKVESLAKSISQMIMNYEADIVLDLHESKHYKSEETYAVGHSIIYNDFQIAPLVDNALDYLNRDEIEPYVYFCEEKKGTLNTEISAMGIPVITLEVDTGKPMEERIEDQTKFVKFVLDTFHIISD